MEQEQHTTLWGPAYGPEHQNGEELISDIHSLYLIPENLLDYSPLPQSLDLSDSPCPYINDPSDDIDISTYGLLEFPDQSQQNAYVLNHELGGRFLGNYEHRTSWGTGDLSYLSIQEPSLSPETNYSPSNTEYYYQSPNIFTPEPWGALSSLSSSFCSSDVDDSTGYLGRPYSQIFDDISVTSQQSLQQGEEYSNSGPRWRHARPIFASNSTGSDRAEAQPDLEKPLRCVECNIGFRHRRNLERHKSTTHADTISRYVCHHESCDGKGFVRKDKLTEHLRRHHGERIPSRSSTLPCPTSIPPHLASSVRGPNRSGQMLSSSVPDSSQSKRQPTPFFCKFEDCIRYKSGFRTLSDLQRHQRDVHDVPSGDLQDKGYKCTSKNCPTPDKTWSRLDNLRSHIRNLHGDEDIQNLIRGSEISKFDLFADKESQSDTPFVFSRYHIKMSKER